MAELSDRRSLSDLVMRTRQEPFAIVDEVDFQSLCDRSLAGLYVVQDGFIRYANPAMGQLLAVDPQDLIGRDLLSFVDPCDQPLVEEQMHRRLNGDGESTRFEAHYLRNDGTRVFVEVLGSRHTYAGRQALMGAMIDITARREAELATEERLRFEQLLADLSASFVNLPSDQIGGQIDASLRMLVDFLGNDRSTLVEFSDDASEAIISHSYAVPGFEPFPLGPFPVARLPWFIGEFRRGNIVFVRDAVSELPQDAVAERAYCSAHGLQSNVTIPLSAGGQILGGITFAFFRQCCLWPDNWVPRLRLIGEVYANALLRQRSDEALQQALAENQRLRLQLEQENHYLREQTSLRYQHDRIIGRSDAIASVLHQAECVAATDAPVLLLGETGTGKELLAQTIHEHSKRRDRPMVVVNCAALPAMLIESELFGREAGAYTGAASAQSGRFMIADGSTLFLDEIGELPIELQAKLLRVLQDGRFERLGSPKTIQVDVRIIAATNRNLEQAVRDGRFRVDLYHRLRVFPIQVPPLRERREDIPMLVWSFAESFSRRLGKSIKSIPRKTMQQLQSYTWPGNIRELSNVIERAMILVSGDTLYVDLPTEDPFRAMPQKSSQEHDREQILRVLQETGWRIRGEGGAAERLDVKPTTLEARMAKFGIKRP